MVNTILMDYDGTLHDWDAVLIRSLDGILGLNGLDFYNTYTHDIHRGIVHTLYPQRHDDMMFHCELLFQHLNSPFDPEVAELICQKFDEAAEQAQNNPIYFTDAIPALDKIREAGLRICLSTGTGAERKAETLMSFTGVRYFSHIFSEKKIGYLKIEPSYYSIALEQAGSKPEETASVGDTPMSDILPAKALGIKTVWVNRRDEPKPIEQDQIADYEVKDLLEAVELLVG